jgi:hypothetical protein
VNLVARSVLLEKKMKQYVSILLNLCNSRNVKGVRIDVILKKIFLTFIAISNI